ncbi:MAG: hypothetical protein A3A86_08635 [Elusimicrobia bacterium RIFCSPLOWO2_01_FULL_60_11]|nr:MAG: hypothetical protein A3A86_08635 [Elusimicrobia bacterium RIFCSPLOWO2_01_FULL_60_11]
MGTCFHPFRNSNTPYACTFDSDNNASSYHSAGDGDWYALTMTAAGIYDFSNALFNADISTPGTAGRSAQGASVSVNDDNSAVAYVQRTGSFTVTNIATGTWTLTVSTGLYTQVITTMVITPSLSTHVPNGVTIPRWYYSGAPVIALTSTTVYGYISGTVRDALQRGISGATVDVAGAGTVTTNSQGRYRVNVEPTADSVLVMASKTAYSTESDAVNGVTLGVETSGVDFILVSAGSYKGFITSNGLASGKIPGVSVVARDLSSATVVAQAISGADGFYYLNGIATGSYIISPQLESGENNVPGVIMADVTVTPQVGWSTFTIANAYGELAGLVGTGSSTSPVTTGVLVVASPVAIDTEYPPDVNEGIRNGGTIYYSVSSDASGRYNMPIRGGSSYYIYGWFTNSVSVNTSSTTKKTLSGAPFWIFPGETTTKDVVW